MEEKRPKDCQNCQKPCTIHLTQITDGKVSKVDMCETCPHAKDISEPKQFDLVQSVLSQVLNQQKETGNATTESLVCPHCHFTLEDFKERSRLGCPRCYDVFMPVLESYLSNMHRGLTHIGKRPSAASLSEQSFTTEKEQLSKELTEAIANERFEDAARLRDQIRTIEAQIKEKEKTEKPKPRRRTKKKE